MPPKPSKAPKSLTPPEPARSQQTTAPRASGPLDDFDRLFREFDEFFDRLEQQFLRPSWGRNE